MRPRVNKPLRQERKSKGPLVRAEPKPKMSSRDAWVMEEPLGYVIRRFVPESERVKFTPGSLTEGGWWESSVTTREVAKLAAAQLDTRFLICAVRDNKGTGERHIAIIPRSDVGDL